MVYIMGFFIWIMEEYDFIIIGAGVAGLSAGMYGARLGMKTLILGHSFGSEMPIGGVITTTKIMENWPGEIRISGRDLANKIKEHALSYDLVSIKEEKVERIERKGKHFVVKSSNGEYLGKSVLFATGTKWRKLKVPGGEEFENKGVFYCALCDAPLYRNKVVAVIGGADSGVRGALLLSEYAKKVYIIEVLDKIMAEKSNLEHLKQNKKIEVITGRKVTEIVGKNLVEKIVLDKEHNGEKEIAVDGILVSIGRIALSELAKELGVKVNKNEEIITDCRTSETNIPGVYAAGDVIEKKFKQAITGAAEGCVAAGSAYNYLKNNFQ